MSPELKTRLITAFAIIFGLIAILITSEIFLIRPQVFAALGILISLGLGHELSKILARFMEDSVARIMSIIAISPSILFGVIFSSTEYKINFISSPWLVGFLSVIGLLTTFFGRHDKELFKDVSFSLPTIIFPVFLGSLSLISLSVYDDIKPLLWVIAIVVLSDSLAYFTGKAIGTELISKYLSPKKTVQGIVAHFVSGALFGYILGYLMFKSTGYTFAALGLLTAINAQTFDLLKSSIKREANVKDSGTLLPGHGGLLDRLDGILGGAVIMVIYLSL